MAANIKDKIPTPNFVDGFRCQKILEAIIGSLRKNVGKCG